jgi:hypothetical protein
MLQSPPLRKTLYNVFEALLSASGNVILSQFVRNGAIEMCRDDSETSFLHYFM